MHPTLALLHMLGRLLHIHLNSHGEQEQAQELQGALAASEAEHKALPAEDVQAEMKAEVVRQAPAAPVPQPAPGNEAGQLGASPADMAQQLADQMAAPAHPLGGEADAPAPAPAPGSSPGAGSD